MFRWCVLQFELGVDWFSAKYDFWIALSFDGCFTCDSVYNNYFFIYAQLMIYSKQRDRVESIDISISGANMYNYNWNMVKILRG